MHGAQQAHGHPRPKPRSGARPRAGAHGRSDVVIENFRPAPWSAGAWTRTIWPERFPRLVWVRVSGYGQTGPYRERGGYATIAEAFSGLASFTGYPDRGPDGLGVSARRLPGRRFSALSARLPPCAGATTMAAARSWT